MATSKIPHPIDYFFGDPNARSTDSLSIYDFTPEGYKQNIANSNSTPRGTYEYNIPSSEYNIPTPPSVGILGAAKDVGSSLLGGAIKGVGEMAGASKKMQEMLDNINKNHPIGGALLNLVPGMNAINQTAPLRPLAEKGLDKIDKTLTPAGSKMIKQDPNKSRLYNTTMSTIGGLGEMIPQIGAATMSGMPPAVVMGLTSANSSFDDLVNKGVNKNEAAVRGLVSGLIDGGSMYLMPTQGGKDLIAQGLKTAMSKLGAKESAQVIEKNFGKKVLDLVNNRIIGAAGQGAAIGAASQEGHNLADTALNSAYGNNNVTPGNLSDVGWAAYSGGLTGAGMHGAVKLASMGGKKAPVPVPPTDEQFNSMIPNLVHNNLGLPDAGSPRVANTPNPVLGLPEGRTGAVKNEPYVNGLPIQGKTIKIGSLEHLGDGGVIQVLEDKPDTLVVRSADGTVSEIRKSILEGEKITEVPMVSKNMRLPAPAESGNAPIPMGGHVQNEEYVPNPNKEYGSPNAIPMNGAVDPVYRQQYRQNQFYNGLIKISQDYATGKLTDDQHRQALQSLRDAYPDIVNANTNGNAQLNTQVSAEPVTKNEQQTSVTTPTETVPQETPIKTPQTTQEPQITNQGANTPIGEKPPIKSNTSVLDIGSKFTNKNGDTLEIKDNKNGQYTVTEKTISDKGTKQSSTMYLSHEELQNHLKDRGYKTPKPTKTQQTQGVTPPKSEGVKTKKKNSPQSPDEIAVTKDEKVTETPKFKKWFGDSKVVDENGKPLTVYHGTSSPNDFHEFQVFNASEPGAHFGTKGAANEFVKPTGILSNGERIYPVHLSIKNPLEVHDIFGDAVSLYYNLADLVNAKKLRSNADWHDVVAEFNVHRQLRSQGGNELNLIKSIRNYVKGLGYDGFKYVNQQEDKGSTSWVALEPNQIKSATGNSGEFNPNVNDMTAVGNANDEVAATKESEVPFSNPAIEKRYMADQKYGESIWDKTKSVIKDIWESSTRTFKELPQDTPEFAKAIHDLVAFGKIGEQSAKETVRFLKRITEPIQKNPKEEDMFNRIVILRDLAEDMRNGITEFPFDFNAQEIAKELPRFEKMATKNVQSALTRRKAHWDYIRDNYIKAMGNLGVDVSGKFTKGDYFRHLVLDYMQKQQIDKNGTKGKISIDKDFFDQRKGSKKDIVKDYITTEYSVMSQLIHDTKSAITLKSIIDNYDKSSSAKVALKAYNTKHGTNYDMDTYLAKVKPAYKTYRLRDGMTFFKTMTLAPDIVDQMLSNIGQDFPVSAFDLRNVLAVGGRYKQYVMKAELVDKLNNMNAENTKKPDDIGKKISNLSRKTESLWKMWVTGINPQYAAKYNIRNLTGDIERVIMAQPEVLQPKYVQRAIKELYNAARKDTFTQDLKNYRKLGGFDNTSIVRENASVKDAFPSLTLEDKSYLQKALKLPKEYIGMLQGVSNFRESILRYSAYLYYLDSEKAGKVSYGAAPVNMIRGLKDPLERAFTKSNYLLGAYDRVSETSRFVATHLMPFYRFSASNFSAYVNTLRNAMRPSVAKEQLSAKGKAITKEAVAGQIVKNSAKEAVLMSAFTGIVAAWNNLMFPGDDKDLPDYVRNAPHILLGRDSNGNVRYFSRVGSLSDIAEWFPQLGDMLNGDFSGIYKNPVNKVVSATSPYYKAMMEVPSGTKFYPDVFNRQPDREMSLYPYRVAGVESLGRKLQGLPIKNGLGSPEQLFDYKADPEETAYNKILSMKRDFEQNTLHKAATQTYNQDPRSQALYYYKQSLKYGDTAKAQKFLRQYIDYGGTSKSLDQSLNMLSPLAGLSESQKDLFKRNLTQDQIDILKKANSYYIQLLKSSMTSRKR